MVFFLWYCVNDNLHRFGPVVLKPGRINHVVSKIVDVIYTFEIGFVPVSFVSWLNMCSLISPLAFKCCLYYAQFSSIYFTNKAKNYMNSKNKTILNQRELHFVFLLEIFFQSVLTNCSFLTVFSFLYIAYFSVRQTFCSQNINF